MEHQHRHPPKDTDLRNIIDKLAQFVARNGPEFEAMTKSKQKSNPKFAFLYGGEHFDYYRCKVAAEQASLKSGGDARPQQQQRGAETAAVPPPPPPPPPPSLFSKTAVEAIGVQQAALRAQIEQSEANLNAQRAVLVQQQHARSEEAVAQAQTEAIVRAAARCDLDLADFDAILQPIVDSCTKDSISTGKSWILSHATSREACAVLSQYLLRKVTTQGGAFPQKLHIIYLINDVLHHCARKNAEDLKKALETVVVPMFCNASIAVTEDQETKLNKLLKLWESKSNYFDQSVIEKMKDPTNSYREYTTSLIAQHAHRITPVAQQTKMTFENYQKQHQAFVAHTMQQIQQLEMQKQMIDQQLAAAAQMVAEQQQSNAQNPLQPPPNMNFANAPPFGAEQASYEPPAPSFPPPPNRALLYGHDRPPMQTSASANYNGIQAIGGNGEPTADRLYDFEPNADEGVVANPQSINPQSMNPQSINLSQPPPGFYDGSLPFHDGLPDLSKPPPGFGAPKSQEVSPEDLMPSVPYYELPAGLMVPLIMLEDSEYKPLDPDAIKLPPPAPPSDRLLAAVKAFYAAPNHTRPQDSEGWEKLGLYEYYKAKNAARKQKEDAISSGVRQKSRSPSPIQLEHFPLRSLPARRYRSKSRSLSRERDRSPSKSPPGRKSQSPDRDPGSNNNRKSRKSRRSPTHSSPSRSPIRQFNNRRSSPDSDNVTSQDSFQSSKNDRINRSPSQSEANNGVPLSELDSSNKGHQMLRKMGWTQGAGLGATGQGITTPVSASSKDKDIRDINMSDPYENFRKNKGAAFITRMKERALERSS